MEQVTGVPKKITQIVDKRKGHNVFVKKLIGHVFNTFPYPITSYNDIFVFNEVRVAKHLYQ
jgi:hypothetical protein